MPGLNRYVIVLAPFAPCALLPAVCGCTPTPEKVCTQINDHEARARGASMPDAERTAAIQRCTQRLGAEKEKDSSRYGCLAKCVMASSDVTGLQSCEETCGVAKGVAVEPVPTAEGALGPGAAVGGGGGGGGAAPALGCRDQCTKTLDGCMTSCGDDSQCHGRCNAAYVQCGVGCVRH